MADRLSIYNGALGLLGERKLASLSENRKSRRALDTAWDSDFDDYVLSRGLWNFALRTVQATYSTDVTPDFGYRYAFDKPSDWVRTAQVSADEYFNYPLDAYADEQDYLWTDLQIIYWQYVSNDNSYGGSISRWTAAFVKYVEAYLAELTANEITSNRTDAEAMGKLAKKRLTDARSIDAMDQPNTFGPYGSWVNARHRRARSVDRARNSLIG